VVDFFKKFSALTVIGNGLIDGINPCAFAVIVFFISFLGVYGYKKVEMVLCWGILLFSSIYYLSFNRLRVFNFFYSLEQVYLIVKAFYYFVAIFCFVMAIAAIWDYYKFKKTGRSEEAILQLPKIPKEKDKFCYWFKNAREKGRDMELMS